MKSAKKIREALKVEGMANSLSKIRIWLGSDLSLILHHHCTTNNIIGPGPTGGYLPRDVRPAPPSLASLGSGTPLVAIVNIKATPWPRPSPGTQQSWVGEGSVESREANDLRASTRPRQVPLSPAPSSLQRRVSSQTPRQGGDAAGGLPQDVRYL